MQEAEKDGCGVLVESEVWNDCWIPIVSVPNVDYFF